MLTKSTSVLHSDSTDLNALTSAYMKGWEGISDDGTLAFRQEKHMRVSILFRNTRKILQLPDGLLGIGIYLIPNV